MKKVLISGACGFIGSRITEALLNRGIEVHALVQNPKRFDKLDMTGKELYMYEVSFNDYKNLPTIIKERDFDVFIHMAWQGYGKDTNNYQVQIENVMHGCEAAYAAAGLGCKRFILADSSHEYLKSPSDDLRREGELCSIYGAAKRAAQGMCRVITNTNNVQFIGVIFTNIFGPGDMSSRSANTFIRKLMLKEPLDLIEGKHLYDWTYIDDCVAGVLAAAEKGISGKLYYVGNPMLRPFRDIIIEVRDTVAPGVELNFGKYNDDSYIDYTKIDIYGLYRDTGYIAKSNFAESIRKTEEWLKFIDQKQQGEQN